ncbi:SDH family Clp fold serine proteinase [Methanogenium organophilum]|uniref:Serine dehydrogenase proteinase n=1 Tax=Methanogenium organophilum TaxID=2199 RepID=A0A9X9T9E2_METOG|nr:hypothetical protein [Methanogenium organophilum]WAI02545.1 hypothetical protein OU421_00335 [Methanogenium organophilum]
MKNYIFIMVFEQRKEIIQKIENLRNSKVITYVVTSRPNINTMMDRKDLREFYRHLEAFSDNDVEKIDLFIYSHGGDSVVGWALVNLIREYSNKFAVLVPYSAFSCATSVAVGADEIVMSKLGTLGPIDPKVSNEFNPERNGAQIPISVEDIGGYISLLKDKFDMRDEELLSKLAEILSKDVRPLALGNAYRQYIKAREDARKLLELHMDPINDRNTIDRIIETLVEKLYSHSHHVNRKEAKNLGLKVQYSEEFKDENDNLSNLMWDLYLDYEAELQLSRPYVDELPEGTNTKCEIPTKYIESVNNSSVFVIEQEWINKGFQEGAKVSNTNNGPGVFIPPSTLIPIPVRGQLVQMNNLVYEKRETTYWKSV